MTYLDNCFNVAVISHQLSTLTLRCVKVWTRSTLTKQKKIAKMINEWKRSSIEKLKYAKIC